MSYFSKGKWILIADESIQLSDLSQSISTLLSNMDDVEKNFGNIHIKQLKEWKKENIGETLFAQKRKLFKNRTNKN